MSVEQEAENPSTVIHRAVRQLNAQVARKIAAGEVIDRPNAIIRELMDNAVDSGADRIEVEVYSGGIEKIRVIDNGSGMTKEDLSACARPHATSKIDSETDLLHLTTLGFRGEALSSMAAVSRLEIHSGSWKMNASVTEDHLITPCSPVEGTIVQTSGLFENFPARRLFLKRPSSEAVMCRTTFEEKVLPRPDISFILRIDGEEKLNLPKNQTLVQRFVEATEIFENEELFYEIGEASPDGQWSFRLVIGDPSVTRSTRKDISIYVNGRKIQEYSLVQAIEYGAQGYFPNGLHPVACLFVTIDPSLVDFNIHPAKKEARFKDISALHHGVSTSTRNFFTQYTVKNIINTPGDDVNSDTYIEDISRNLDFNSPQDNLSVSAVSGDSGNSHFSGSYHSPSYNLNHGVRTQGSDLRSSFLGGSSLAKAFSEAVLNPESDASVEGHKTKPNYIEPETETSGNPQETQESHEYIDDKNFHFVGSTLGTFLIAEKNDVLYIIDQHAAHERYLYNEIVAHDSESQKLLIPYEIETASNADDNYLREIKESLHDAGFNCTEKGNGHWEISTVPVRWKGTQADLVHDIIDKRLNPSDILNSIAAMTACKAAVKDGTVLDSKTAAWIASEALKLPDPHCPHGRPVYTTITRKQLFTLVKRI